MPVPSLRGRGETPRVGTGRWRLLHHEQAALAGCWCVLLQAPGYSKVVKEPMCFDTMREKLRAGRYLNWDQFEYDMALVFDNAQAYNPHGANTRLFAA